MTYSFSPERGWQKMLHTRISGRLAWIGLVLLVILALAMPVLVKAASQSGDNVVLTGSHDDMQFLSGRDIRVRAAVDDDVFAVGRFILFDSATTDHSIVMGEEIRQRDGASEDIIALGSLIEIAGTVSDDLVAAGRSIRIDRSGSVLDDVRAAAETIDIDGPIGGNVTAAASRITIRGRIGGDADLRAERIIVAPGGVIAGNLDYVSPNAAEIAQGAEIGGAVRRVAEEATGRNWMASALAGLVMTIMLAWLLSVLVLSVAIQLAFPHLMDSAAERLKAKPWANLGIGIAVLISAGVASMLLFGTLIGIPAGLALATTAGIVWVFGLIALYYYVGLLLGRRSRWTANIGSGARVGLTIAGLVIVVVVTIIPLVGFVITNLAAAAGFGAVASDLWRRLRPNDLGRTDEPHLGAPAG
jgi:cytoskeletal protein CcmA (bactofilin family)